MLEDINTWFSGIDWFEKVFWLLAIPSTLTFLFIMITTFLGGEVDSDIPDADADISADGGIGFQFITVKNLVGFFTIFSWSGLACINSDLGSGLTIIISFASGLAMMLIMAGIYYLLSTMVDDGTLNVNNALGRIGEVYINIPPNGEGIGKIQINIQGALREMNAMTKEQEILKNGTVVKVIEVIDGHILLVTKNTSIE
jgi:hypothetical protein